MKSSILIVFSVMSLSTFASSAGLLFSVLKGPSIANNIKTQLQLEGIKVFKSELVGENLVLQIEGDGVAPVEMVIPKEKLKQIYSPTAALKELGIESPSQLEDGLSQETRKLIERKAARLR